MLGATSHNLVALLTRSTEFANPYCEIVSEVMIHPLGKQIHFIFLYCKNLNFLNPTCYELHRQILSAAGNETGLSQVASGVGAGLIRYGVMFRRHSDSQND
jgi:hypothetical protein